MEEARSNNELESLHQALAFLWNDHGFHVEYLASGYGAQPRGLLVGLGNKTLRLLFEQETGSALEGTHCRVGTGSPGLRLPITGIPLYMAGIPSPGCWTGLAAIYTRLIKT